MSYTTTSAICYGPGFDTLDMNPWRPRWVGRGKTKVRFEQAVEESELFDEVTFFSKDILDSGRYQYSLLCMRLWLRDASTVSKGFKQIELHPDWVKKLRKRDIQQIVQKAEKVAKQELKELEA